MGRENDINMSSNWEKSLSHIIFSGAIIFLLSGCMANMANSVGVDLSNAKAQDELFIAGEYGKAAALACEDKDKETELDEANLLSNLYAGNCYLYDNNNVESLKHLDESEAIIKFHHEETLACSTADYVGQLLLNDAALDYHATITDSIMVNTYKALNNMALNRFSDARVELNRAIDRQRRAKETYAELIGKQKEAIADKRKEAKEKGTQKEGFAKTLNNPAINDMINKNYSTLGQFEAYPDFVNPFTTYLAGLFFALEGDYTKSSSLLKEVHGMMPKNEVVESDFNMVENALSGKKIENNHVWVIYENGLGPIKSQYKINIPLFAVSDEVLYTGIALPKLNLRNKATPDMSVLSNGEVLAKTSVVGDMDRVIMTEFDYSYKDIVIRAVFSAVLKTYAQYEAKNQNGYLGLATAIFQSATTRADTRVWNTIPKDFQIAKIEMPKDRKLVLQAGNQNIDVEVAKDAKNSIIHVKLPTVLSKPSVSVINF